MENLQALIPFSLLFVLSFCAAAQGQPPTRTRIQDMYPVCIYTCLYPYANLTGVCFSQPQRFENTRNDDSTRVEPLVLFWWHIYACQHLIPQREGAQLMSCCTHLQLLALPY
ncbi:hypothetical protein B0T14DRAFT_20779 [Immersiella caudata]|uniref:Secreted protein n=1 Tax=Immersiella caudata TaxID=314043 RepID=A0AA39XDP6_9PEZI|nr:hypothetical protein B0T14DRAFT_20779 [Immersiella caudata]